VRPSGGVPTAEKIVLNLLEREQSDHLVEARGSSSVVGRVGHGAAVGKVEDANQSRSGGTGNPARARS
jgi:hypothetical protein